MFAEQVFDEGRSRDRAAAQHWIVPEQREDLLERRATLRELARGAERDGHRERQLEAQLGSLAVGEQAKRRAEPFGCRRGRPCGGGVARLRQCRDRLRVAEASRPLEMAGTRAASSAMEAR